jgi:hypothetical protein
MFRNPWTVKLQGPRERKEKRVAQPACGKRYVLPRQAPVRNERNLLLEMRKEDQLEPPPAPPAPPAPAPPAPPPTPVPTPAPGVLPVPEVEPLPPPPMDEEPPMLELLPGMDEEEPDERVVLVPMLEPEP